MYHTEGDRRDVKRAEPAQDWAQWEL